MVVHQVSDHSGREFGIIGGVPIHQEVDLGLDVREHAPDHVALALQRFTADNGAAGPGNLGGAVGGVVVIDIDLGLGQGPAEIGNHLGDGRFFVVTRDKNGNCWFHHGSVVIILARKHRWTDDSRIRILN